MQKRKRKVPRTPSNRRSKASTSDVLAPFEGKAKVKRKWQKHYRMLVDLRTELRNRKGHLLKDALEERTSIQREMADVGTNSYDRDWALSMISSDQNALYEIEQALKRIRDGTYGTCELTGKAIPVERLNAIPWTRFSAESERNLEKRGELEHAKLGPRERVPHTPATRSVGDEG